MDIIIAPAETGAEETMMSTYMLWVTGAAIAVLLAEIIFGRHRGAYKRKGEMPLIALSFGVGRFLVSPIAAIIIASVWSTLFPYYRGALEGKVPLWLGLPAILILMEFCFYWVHRWAHEGSKRRSLLWMIHRTHHSATYMNVSVWMRLNIFWYFIVPNTWVISFAIYLGLPEAAGIAVAIIALWNIVTHSDFRWDDSIRSNRRVGPVFRGIEHLIVSPGIHHTHHGFGKDGASYRNFAVMFSMWDWMFGTLHIPTGRPHRYGLPGHNAHWLEELAYPLVQIRSKKPETTLPPENARSA